METDPETPREGHDVFVSYAREDQSFVRRLTEALAERGKRSWVDWADIPPTAEWMAEIRGAIDASDTYVVVLSPDSVRSKICAAELDQALQASKRIVPVLAREVDESEIPPEVAKLNWVAFTEGFEPALDRLTHALDTDLEHVRAHTRLLVRAREWEASRDHSLLLRGRDLSQAETWLGSAQSKEPASTREHTAYLLASRRAATRRQRGAFTGIAIALILSVTLSAIAVVQGRRATDAKGRAERQATVAASGRLAANARAELESNPELSLLLALEALGVARTEETIRQLRQDLEAYPVLEVLPHPESVSGAAYSPDGNLVATVAIDGELRIFDASDWSMVSAMGTGHGPLTSVAWRPDGSQIATTSADGRIAVWDASSGELVFRVRAHEGSPAQPMLPAIGDVRQVSMASYSDDGGRLVSAGQDGTAIVWDADSGDALLTLAGHQSEVTTASFSTDGERILTSGADARAILWDTRTGKPLQVLREPSRTIVWTAGFDPSGQWVITGETSTATVWNVKTGVPWTTFRSQGLEVLSASFDPADMTVVLTSGADEAARLWVWDPTFEGFSAEVRSFAGHLSRVPSATFSPDGRYVVTAGDDGTARVWKTFEADLVRLPPQGGGLFDVAQGPDGQIVVTAGERGATLWNLATGKAERSLGDADQQYEAVDVSPAGDQIVTASPESGLEVWDTVSGERLLELRLKGAAVEVPESQRAMSSVEFSPTGTKIAATEGGALVGVWDAVTGQLLVTLSGVDRGIWDVSWSPDEQQIVAASNDGTSRVWDVASEETVAVLEQDAEIYGAEFSPDGNFIATSSEDLTVRIWDAASGTQLRVLRGHSDPVLSVNFSADGGRLVTTSTDRTVRVWDTESGLLLDVMGGFVNNVWRAEFLPDADRVVAISSDWTLQLFRCELCRPIGELVALARSRVSRDLTPQERDQFDVPG